MAQHNIKEAKSDEEILACWDAVQALRPHVKEENVLLQVRKQQAEGYRLMYIADPESKKVLSICGFRVYAMLWSGRTIYIDDLSTLAEGRGRGYLWWCSIRLDNRILQKERFRLKLDSGHTRHTAHRLYHNKGFVISSHHFVFVDEK